MINFYSDQIILRNAVATPKKKYEKSMMVKLFCVLLTTFYFYFLPKVRVGEKGSCHRYGMVAIDDIHKGDCLFEIPRTLVLHPKTSSISHILVNGDLRESFNFERG